MSSKKVIGVFGATGFVGTEILKQLRKQGCKAIAFSRQYQENSDGVKWYQADANNPDSFLDSLTNNNCESVIISVGSPPLPTFSEEAFETKKRENGQNIYNIISTSKKAGVKHVVLINATMPSWAPKGYVEGKLMAKEAAKTFASESDDNGAVVLFPASINGTRTEHILGHKVPIPLWMVLSPLSFLFQQYRKYGFTAFLEHNVPLVKGLLEPMPQVSQVARVSVAAATEDSFYGKYTEFSNQDIIDYK